MIYPTELFDREKRAAVREAERIVAEARHEDALLDRIRQRLHTYTHIHPVRSCSLCEVAA